MKVLAIAKTLTKGGAATGARNTIEALETAGAMVVAMEGFAAQTDIKRRVLRTSERVYERLAHGADVHCLKLGPPTFTLEKLCREHQPDIIQLFDVSGNTIAFDDLNRLDVPVVQRMSDFWPYHGAHHYAVTPPANGALEEWWLKRTIYSGQARPDLLVTPSQWLADQLRIGPTKVIRNAVAKQPAAVPRKAPHNPLRFGFIANPIQDPRKGVAKLAPVLDMVAATVGEIELHLFGNGSARGIVAGPAVTIRKHNGFQKHKIASVYEQFDILLCPSRHDNSPNVLTEALSFGLPVVAQSGTGMDSYVDEHFGALVDFHTGSPVDAALQIAVLLGRYSEASAAALQFARMDLAPEKIGSDYLAAYKKLLQHRQT